MGHILKNLSDTRKYKFSNCCVSIIKFALGMDYFKCLHTVTNTKFISTNKLPGDAISKNETCRNVLKELKKENGFHEDMDDRLAQCILRCRTPIVNGRSSLKETPAPDGTRCGTSKICKHGICVAP
ncbi:uncharacterized protein LOC120846740 [Ixodes scapularis]|uniref:uncharacterized protein LOC120846740 n=1 Tax=Ixodes scapularis TaxID=6945 RepID=UPI001A9EBEA0|nr:uncharacterized protein LOC120846740 [Ixodes scapularis]